MKTFFVQPLITEKSMAMTGEGIYQFAVPTWANKRQIAEHVASHFNVVVEDVKTSRLIGKKVVFKRSPGKQNNVKKASIHLQKGQSIADFALPVEEQAPAPTSPEAEPQAKPVDTKTESKITVRSKSGRSKTSKDEV